MPEYAITSNKVNAKTAKNVISGIRVNARLLKEEDADLLNWFSLESSPDDDEFKGLILEILKWKRDP